MCVEKIHLKVPVPAGSSTTGNTVQKNGKNSRTKPGPGSHPQPPLFSTLDVSTLKAPTGSSFVGQGFCGHHPPHSAGSLLDCVSTTERTLSKNSDDKPNVQIENGNVENNTSTFVRSVNDNVSTLNKTSTAWPKVKVSQISVTVKPNCVKTSTPPLTNPSRRTATTVSKSLGSTRKSVSSPEPMSIGGDDTTSSEKGSRSPSPPRSLSGSQSEVSASQNHNKNTPQLLDNDPQKSTQGEKLNVDNAGTHIEASETMLPSSRDIRENTLSENDNMNGNVNVGNVIVARR